MGHDNDNGNASMEEDDDDGFVGYVVTTVSVGGGLMAIGVVAFFLAYGVILPLLVVVGGRREGAQRAALEETFLEEMDPDAKEVDENELECKIEVRPDNEDPGVQGVPRENQSGSSSLRRRRHHQEDEDEGSCSGRSTKSWSSNPGSEMSSAVAAILDRPRVPRNKAQRKRRRAKERQMLEATKRINAGNSKNANSNQSTNNDKSQDPTMVSLLQAIHPGAIPKSTNNDPKVAESGSHGSEVDDEFLEETIMRPEFSTTLPLSDIMVGYPHLQQTGDFAKLGSVDKITTISAWDMEMQRIIKLSLPYCTQSLITGVTDMLSVAVIGRLIGTREVSAYVIVNLLVELTSEFVGGFHEALATLCSQAIGAGNKELAGTYVQIVTLLYTIFFIPFMIFWALYMDAVLRWFGFDEETVQIGKHYCYILTVDLLFDGVGEAIHGLLDVGGLEQFSTFIGATEEVLAFLTLLLVALYGRPGPGLVTVGLIQFTMGIFFLILNVCVIYWKGWFLPYSKGMIGSFALKNGKAVYLVCKTALSLSMGMLLTDGEWELLTILASNMGPAEVAAWGILDTIWNGTHELIDGLADAGEVRCAFLLGSGQPERAKLSAYKSTMLGGFAGLFLTSLIYMAGEDLPTWFTTDPTLQAILTDLLPLFGLGNLVMALDTMSWTLLGSQGRYRLATIVVCLSSWIVTLPLALLFTFAFNVGLEGLLISFSFGYIFMGVAHMYFLLRSNWQELSLTVMEDNDAIVRALAVGTSGNSSTSPSSITSRKSPSQSALSVSVGSRTSSLSHLTPTVASNIYADDSEVPTAS